MKGQNIPLFREGQGPKDAHLRFDAPPGQTMADFNGVQGTSDHPIRLESENAEPIFLCLDGVKTVNPILKNVVIPIFRLEMGTKFRRLWQEWDDPFKFPFINTDLEPGATTLLDRGTACAGVVDGTNGPVIDL